MTLTGNHLQSACADDNNLVEGINFDDLEDSLCLILIEIIFFNIHILSIKIVIFWIWHFSGII